MSDRDWLEIVAGSIEDGLKEGHATRTNTIIARVYSSCLNGTDRLAFYALCSTDAVRPQLTELPQLTHLVFLSFFSSLLFFFCSLHHHEALQRRYAQTIQRLISITRNSNRRRHDIQRCTYFLISINRPCSPLTTSSGILCHSGTRRDPENTRCYPVAHSHQSITHPLNRPTDSQVKNM